MPEDIRDYGSQFDTPKEVWMAGGSLPDARNTFYPAEIQYNQKLVDAYSCTLHGNATAISSLTGYVFTTKELSDIWTDLINLRIARAGWGAYTSRVVDYMRKYWNSKKQDKISSFTTSLGSAQSWELLDKGYTLIIGGRVNSKYWKDVFDGKLDELEFGASKFGHVFCLTKVKDKYLLVENYDERGKDNTIEITKDQINKLKMPFTGSNGVYFYPSAYYFAFDEALREKRVVVSTWAQVAVEKAKKAGIIKDWSNPQEIVGGEKLEWVFENLGLLDKQKHTGGVPLEELAVVLDRLGLLDK